MNPIITLFREKFSNVGWIPSEKERLESFILSEIQKAREETLDEVKKMCEKQTHIKHLNHNPMKSNAPMGNRSIPSKLDYGARTCTAKGVVEKVNDVISFIDYFIHETEKCCTCGGCPKHPNFIARWLKDKPIVEKTLAQKFQAHRSKMGEGHTEKYWEGLERIAKEYFNGTL